jgi:hypothetical protein
MGRHQNGKAAPATTAGRLSEIDLRDGEIEERHNLDPALTQVARAFAWAKVLDALSQQRAAIEYRIARADPDDIYLEFDVYDWVVLADSLTAFLKSRGAL